MIASWTLTSRRFEVSELLEESCLAPNQVRNPVLLDLTKRWHHAAGLGRFPDRQAFLPETLGGALGRLMILQIEGEDEPRFRYRLFGINICAIVGYDLTGRTTEDIPNALFSRRIWSQNHQASLARRPSFYAVSVTDGHDLHHYEKIILPVTANDHSDQLLACSFPVDG